MLDLTAPFLPAFICGLLTMLLFGSICSLPSVWNACMKTSSSSQVIGGVYLKAGEYGESEGSYTSWSVFIEPLNAWSSLFYSLFGFVILFIGAHDSLALTTSSSSAAASPRNTLAAFPAFSVLYGLSAIYLGIASFLFHASHSEVS